MRRDRLMAVPLACACFLGAATARAQAAVAPKCEAAADVRAPDRVTGLARRTAAAHARAGALASDAKDRVEPATRRRCWCSTGRGWRTAAAG